MEGLNIKNVWPDWTIQKVLGRGAYATVYQAIRQDHGVESFAAIKVISVPNDSCDLNILRAEGLDGECAKSYLQNIVKNFVQEIQLMESLKGIQNIVSVEDYKVVEKKNEIGWDILIRMELLTPFSEWICNHSIAEKDVIRLGMDICQALKICEQRHIIHRDIKPENIFVNDFGYFKLGDFGVARTMETMAGSLSQSYTGTYAYMAPEVALQKDYDARVDQYSLGLVLYRLLNNNHFPFLDTEENIMNPNERQKAAKRRITGEQLPVPCNASRQMANVILKACAYNPNDRFVNADAMEKALVQVEEGTYFETNPAKEPDSARDHDLAEEHDTPKEPEHSQVESSNTKNDNIIKKKSESFSKKNKRRGLLMGLSVLLAIILVATVLIPMMSRSKKEFLQAIDQQDYEAAAVLLSEHERLGSNKEAVQKLKDQITALQQAYQNNSVEYTDIRNQLNLMQLLNMDEVNNDIEAALEFADQMKDSRTEYKAAEELYQDGFYAEAIAHYGKVMKEDPNYTNALAKIDDANVCLRDKTIEEAEALAKEGNYKQALSKINTGLKAFPDNAQLKEKYNQLEKELNETAAAAAVSEAEALAAGGDYVKALEILKSTLDNGSTNALLQETHNRYADEYALLRMNEIETLKQQKDYREIKRVAKEVLEVLPGRKEFIDILAKVNAIKPVLLNELDEFNGGFKWNMSTVPIDMFGNDYSSAENAAIISAGNNMKKSAEYYVDSQYDLLSMTIAPYREMDELGYVVVTVYADGQVAYTSPKIVQKTTPYECKVDITNATYIKIVVSASEQKFHAYASCHVILADAKLWPTL